MLINVLRIWRIYTVVLLNLQQDKYLNIYNLSKIVIKFNLSVIG